MSKGLLIAGGVLNVLFTALHVMMISQIRLVPDLPEGIPALLQMLNAAVALTVLFAAITSFFCQKDLQTTRLGRMTLGLIGAFYLLRAAGEFLFSDVPNMIIFGICLAVALLYGAVLLQSYRPARTAAE